MFNKLKHFWSLENMFKYWKKIKVLGFLLFNVSHIPSCLLLLFSLISKFPVLWRQVFLLCLVLGNSFLKH